MIRTPHFQFPYFQDGDIYSASADEERAIALDLILTGLSEIVDDGIIDGWTITDLGGLDINMSSGKGFISGQYGVTQNNVRKTLSDDTTNYIYATRNSNIADGISTSSNKVQVDFTDVTPPASPSDLAIDSEDERAITLTWIKNLETDIHHYKVYRKLSTDLVYTFITNVDHLFSESDTSVVYIDDGLTPEKEYDYHVSAVDSSGNESSFSSITAETLPDTTPASEVTNIKVHIANESVSLTWDASVSDDLDSYVVTLSELTAEGNISSTITVNVGTNLYYFNNLLTNNVAYRVTIKTLDDFGNVSKGIVSEFTPRLNPAPKEVGSFGYTVTNAASPEPVTPKITFYWSASVSPDVSHYSLYVYDEGRVSEVITIGNNLTKELISYPFREGDVLVSKLFEDLKNYEILLTVTDSEDRESDGIFIKISIPDYSPPPEIKNIKNLSGDGYVDLSWEAADVKDFDSYELYYWNVASESGFSETIEYSSYAANVFSLSAPAVGIYPVGSWVELTVGPEGGSRSVRLKLNNALNPGDVIATCNYIPTYYSQSGTLRIINVPSPVTFSQREYYRVSGLTNGQTYKFILISRDINGNESDGVITTATPQDAIFVLESPSLVTAKGRDREIQITWSKVDNVEGYKVYKAGPLDTFTFNASSADFSLLATVEGNGITSIYDIGLTNDVRYSYMVTSYVDSSESSYDIEDQVIETPVSMANPDPPENVVASVSSGEVNLNWDPPSDITGIEGWNIYRGLQSYGEFKLISSLPFTTLTYTDTGLINGETYFYIIRSFSNTVDINTTVSLTPPDSSILLGTVVTEMGAIKSITPERTMIANLESTVATLTRDFIKNHKHSADIEEEFSDTRNQALKINLSPNEDVTIFTTDDYQNYFSERDLVENTSYVVYINDQIPNLLYEVDFGDNKIVFEKPLYSVDGSSPYSEPPVVRLQFINLKEISGQLHSRFINDIDASKIVSGVLSKALLPSISHMGRIKEEALVRQYVLLSSDNIYFDLNNITYVVDEQNVKISMSTPTLFYDFIEHNGVMYGASSKGILKSVDKGITWESYVQFGDLARKFYKKTVGNDIIYFAICRRNIYATKDCITWFPMSGLGSTGIIHDITEDKDGNVYIAADTGMYVYNLEFASKYRFDATSVIQFGSTTSEVISLLHLSDNYVLAVTTDGIFETLNLGSSWSKYSAVMSLYHLKKYGATRIIASSEDGYLCYSDDNGINWTTVTNFSGIHRDDIFNVIDGRLFFTTSEGVFYTDDLQNIHEINGEFKRRIDKSGARAIYGTEKNDIFISFDNRLYRWKNGKTSLWAEFIGSIPSIYENGELLLNGYYYNVERNDLYFEWKKSYDDICSIAVAYDEYILPGKGWQDIDADDIKVTLYINGKDLGSEISKDVAEEFIDKNEETDEIINKRYEFAYTDQRKLTLYSSDGKIYITGPQLSKFDVIHATIENLTLTNEGVFPHSDIDDALSKKDVGLPFFLGNVYLDNLLQMGLYAEHNFLEYAEEAPYPYAVNRTVRSFNSELINSDHFMFGRKSYDVFNSTIDYTEISSNKIMDDSPFIIREFYEINGETWIATDNNIFVLSADRTSIDREISISSYNLDITSIKEVGDSIYVIASNEIYISNNGGITWTKNEGYGLPRGVYQIDNIFNIIIIGTSDAVYYSQKGSDTWTKSNFYNENSEVITVNKQVSSIVVPGMAYCLIDNIVYKSINGVTWRETFSFDSLLVEDLVVDRLFSYSNNMFALTNKGLYNDIGSLNNAVSNANFDLVQIDLLNSTPSIKDFSYSGDTILILAEKNTLYKTDDAGSSWTKQTIFAVDFVDLCHIWTRIEITDDLITQMNLVGIPIDVTNKLVPLKNIIYGTENALNSALAGVLTDLEYNNYSDEIIENSYSGYLDTEMVSCLEDIYLRQIDLSFIYGCTVARADRVYTDNLVQPAVSTEAFDKVSVFLTPLNNTNENYSVTLFLYGADSSNNVVSGILSADTKSSLDMHGPGWYNFRLYYSGEYDRIVLVLRQNYGDNNNYVKWNYSINVNTLAAINNSGVQNYSYNYILWKYEDAVDEINHRVSSDPAKTTELEPAVGSGTYVQTEFEDSKVKLALDDRVLTFMVDQSGSMTWNDYYGYRFDLMRQFASDLNNIYPGNLYYTLASYESKIIDTLGIELIDNGDDSIYGGTYRIVRRTDRYPTTPIDGSIIASTGLTVANDDTVIDGTGYYYAIFNMRSDSVYSSPRLTRMTVHSRILPLPVSGLVLEEEIVKETIGIPAASVDTGKRKIIIKFNTIQNYSTYYNSVRIVRKTCYQDTDIIDDSVASAEALASKEKHETEDDKIANPHDGVVIYEGAIISGENIVIDDFSGTMRPLNGVKYYYSIYTCNTTGNYCMPQNALQESIRISSVWRAWMYDPTYVPSQISSEFLVSPSDVNDFAVEAGNTQNKISWTMPIGDTAMGVMLYVSEIETPDIDPLKVAHYDATGTTSSVSSDKDTSNTGASFGSGKLIYQGIGNYFVHRELSNNKIYYYRVYTFNRVRTISAGNPIGQAIPTDDVLDDFEPPSPKNFYAEIFNSERIILRWQREEFYKKIIRYFDDLVSIRSYAYDENGTPITEIEDFDFKLISASFKPKPSLEIDGGASTESQIMNSADYLMAVDKESYSGEIRAGISLVNAINSSLISNYSSANFEVSSEYKIYDQEKLEEEQTDPETTAAEVSVETSLFEDGLVESASSEALQFSLESDLVSFTMLNPLTVSVRNKYPETQKVAQKEMVETLIGTEEVVTYYDGVYAKSGVSYYGDIEIAFEQEALEDADSVTVRAEVYELDHVEIINKVKKRIWKKTPSTAFLLETNDIEIGKETRQSYVSVGEEGEETEMLTDRLVNVSFGTFRLLPPDLSGELNILVTVVVNGYVARIEHFLLIKTMLNVDLQARAPIADGKDVAEQIADVYVGPPKYDEESKLPRYPVPNGTIVKWELEKGSYGEDRPFYSSESVPLQDGVYSVVRNGIARNIYFGPASDVKKHYNYNFSEGTMEIIGEKYTIKTSAVYNGMFGRNEKDVEIKPLDTTGSSYRFFMTNTYEMLGHNIYADGETPTEMEFHADPLATGGDGGEKFYDCLDLGNMPHIILLEGQRIELQTPNFGNIKSEDTDVYYSYKGKVYKDPEEVPILIGSDGSGKAKVSASINAFIGPPPKEKETSESEEDIQYSKCALYGNVPAKSSYPPVVDFSAQSQMIFGGKSITLLGGGSRTTGIPPVVVVLKEPLSVKYQKMMSNGSVVLNPPNDGLNSTDIYFEISFSEKTIPEGSRITFSFVFFDGEGTEITVQQLENMSENEKKTALSGFASYEEFLSSLSLQSYSALTTNVSGKSVAHCILNPTKIKKNTVITLKATSTYDKLGTVNRTMSDYVKLKFTNVDEKEGGMSAYLKKVERYDPVSDEWVEIDPLNVGRVGPVCEYDAVTEKIFTIGGLTESGISVTGEQFEYSRPDKSALNGSYGSWSYITSMNYGRGFSQSVIYEDKSLESSSSIMSSYSLITSSSSSQSSSSQSSSSLSSSSESSNSTISERSSSGGSSASTASSSLSSDFSGAVKIFVMGGFGYDPFSGNSGPNANNIVEAYDTTFNKWQVLRPMPHPVSHGCAELIGDNIYVFSGLTSLIENDKGYAAETFNNYLMKYNIPTNTWTVLDELDPFGNALTRISPVSYVRDRKIYVFGGIINDFDPKNPDDALFVNTMVEIDVSDEDNISYTVIPYTNSPIQRFRAGAYALFNDEFYVMAGSGIKSYVDGSVTKKYQSNTLRELEKYNASTNTWTTYRNLAKMTYERHSLGSTDDSEYLYAIGGGGSGYEPGKLIIKITLDPTTMRADGRTQVSASIYLEDTTGEPPEDGIKIVMAGYILVDTGQNAETVSAGTVSNESVSTNQSESGAVSEMANKVSAYPVLFSALNLYSKDGNAATILLERSEDVMVALQDLVEYINGDDEIIGLIYDEESKKIKVPKRKALKIKPGEERDLYQIIIEATIEDDFYFGNTDTEKTMASQMSKYLEQNETSTQTEAQSVNEDNSESTVSNVSSLTTPEEADQDESPTLPVYCDLTWIPYVNDDYDIMDYSQFVNEVDLLSQKIPFGGSPHWDALINFAQGTLKEDSISSLGKIMIDVSDNEENLSKNTLDDAIGQIQVVDGYGKLGVFTNIFVTAFPPSLAARKGQADVVDLERLAGETYGLSHTIIDSSYIDPVVRRIKIGAMGAIGRGTYTQVVDFEKLVHIVSLTGFFELYAHTNGWIEIEYSSDGYNYESLGVIHEADVSSAVNVTARYIRFIVTLTSEFGDPIGMTTVPPPAFLRIQFTYSEPNVQYIFTYSHDLASYIREIYLTMNGEIPFTSDVQLGITMSNSTIWDDYQKDSQPSVSQNGRIVIVNSKMSLLNLIADPSQGGDTPLTYKTYEEIMDDFKQEKQTEYGKIIDGIVILEYRTGDSDGRTKIVFADGSSREDDEAPDFSNAIDFSTIEGSDPTKFSTSGTILNYDFIYSFDGYIFVSQYGRWQPGAVVNVYRNGILVDSTEYVLLRPYGAVKFYRRQRLTNNYAIEVSVSPEYRIGLEVTNRHNEDYAILDEFAYVYNTDFLKSTDYTNSIPMVTNLNVTPLSPKTTSTFTANYTYSDKNNDIERNSEIQWYINGGIVPELKDKTSWKSSDLIKNTLKDGDRIFFTVKPSDGRVYGALTHSTTAYLGDTAPSISGLKLIYTGSNGVVKNTPTSDSTISVQYTYYDVQGRAESGSSCEWFVNNQSIVYNTSNPKILPSSLTDASGNYIISRGNVIKARVVPSNGIIKGSVYETEEVVILNTAPLIFNVLLSPDKPDENSVLTMSYNYQDRDGDSDNTEIKWYRNNELVTSLNNSKQVNASFLNSGDSWYADLTAYDGETRGLTTRTSTVIIT